MPSQTKRRDKTPKNRQDADRDTGTDSDTDSDTDSKTATDNETATSDANTSEYFADLEYQESDLFYDYLYSEYLDEGVDTDTTVPRRAQPGPQDSKDADRGRRQDGAAGEVDLKTDNR